VDFSFWSYKSWKKMEGLGVQAVMGGTVAAVIHNRYPYGNMVMIETPLDDLPIDLPINLNLPTPAPTLDLSQNPLTCPTAVGPTFVIGEKRSLYLVYAHLYMDPSVKPGDRVICGQNIGEVGNSGDSSNPHLHLEARVGPVDAHFSSMAHYVNDSTDEERYNYCTWRMSGLFQIIDPMRLLASDNQ
jgi:murein DD-endopeptidase MepM/ murein hydrolase activator NlpD